MNLLKEGAADKSNSLESTSSEVRVIDFYKICAVNL